MSEEGVGDGAHVAAVAKSFILNCWQYNVTV
jgi:hypothetical protein